MKASVLVVVWGEDIGFSVGDPLGSDDAHGLHAVLQVSVTPLCPYNPPTSCERS